MNIDDVKDKGVAMIVWNTQKENDVQVYLGTIQNVDGEYAFINKETGWKVSLDDEQLSRLRPVSEELKKTMLDADYAFSMRMGILPDPDDKGGFKNTGIKW